jgi:hypothetical protein
VYAAVWLCGPSAVVWGDVATWLATGAAAVAGVWAYKAYKAADATVRIERARDAAAQEREDRSQADAISAWCVDAAVVNPTMHGKLLAAVSNRSQQPVFDVHMDLVQGEVVTKDCAVVPVLAPSGGLVYPGSPIEPAPALKLGLRFTDVQGIRWARDPDGQLSRTRSGATNS